MLSYESMETKAETSDEAGRTAHGVGEVFRRWGAAYSRTHRMTKEQRRALRDLAECRTAALGGHTERCECGFERPAYNSCGNRNCPVCLGVRSRQWLAARLAELLPVPYFHCVFTLPDTFNALIPAAPAVFYALMFRAMWATVEALSRRCGYGVPGVIAVLHTWGQSLWPHPHLHILITGGGLGADGAAWHPSPPDFLFDVHEMSAEYRDRFCRLLERHAADFASAPADAVALAESERRREWVVFCKRPVTGAPQAAEYLARYSHRTALANRRILDVSAEGVTFLCKDYRRAEGDGPAPAAPLTLDGIEFIRRFMWHILPDGFKRIRCYGILAGNCRRARLARCRELLGPTPRTASAALADFDPEAARRCPACGKRLFRIARLPSERGPPLVLPFEPGRKPHAA